MVQLTETNERKDLEHSLLHVIYLLQYTSLNKSSGATALQVLADRAAAAGQRS